MNLNDAMLTFLSDDELMTSTELASLWRTLGKCQRLCAGIDPLDTNTPVERLKLDAIDRERIQRLRLIKNSIEPELWSLMHQIYAVLIGDNYQPTLAEVGRLLFKPAEENLIDMSPSNDHAAKMTRIVQGTGAQAGAGIAVIRSLMWRTKNMLTLYERLVAAGKVKTVTEAAQAYRRRDQAVRNFIARSQGRAATAPMDLLAA